MIGLSSNGIFIFKSLRLKLLLQTSLTNIALGQLPQSLPQIIIVIIFSELRNTARNLGHPFGDPVPGKASRFRSHIPERTSTQEHEGYSI